MNASYLSQTEVYKVALSGYPDVMSVEQMCEVLSISTKTGYKMLREGKIQSIKVGREYIVTKLDLIDYLMKTQ